MPYAIDLLTAAHAHLKDLCQPYEAANGPIKTFPLRGIKDSPTYRYDGRLLTLEDTVEFFNLILGAKPTEQEKQDLVAVMRAL
jgi:cytochrome c peroxidase